MDRSVDSIGSCSLDVDADSTDFSDTSGELNFLTPNSAKDIQREFTAGIKERCKIPVINCQAVTTVLDPVTGNISTVLTTTSPQAETTTTAVPSKKPSYLNLACCVNGYSNLTTYDSKLRQDINKSREVSPNRPIIATLHYNRGEGGNFQLTAPTLSYISMNNTINNNISNGRISNGSSSVTGTMVNGAGTGRFSAVGGQDVTDNASMFNGNGFVGVGNGGLRTRVISSQSQICSVKESERVIKKSFIQQRVEKLYGNAEGVVISKQIHNSNERKYLNNIANENVSKNYAASVHLNGNGNVNNGCVSEVNCVGGISGSVTKENLDENNKHINDDTDLESLPVMRHLRPEFRAQLQMFSPKKIPKPSPSRSLDGLINGNRVNGNNNHIISNGDLSHHNNSHQSPPHVSNGKFIPATNGTTSSILTSSSLVQQQQHFQQQNHKSKTIAESSYQLGEEHSTISCSSSTTVKSIDTTNTATSYHQSRSTESSSASSSSLSAVVTSPGDDDATGPTTVANNSSAFRESRSTKPKSAVTEKVPVEKEPIIVSAVEESIPQPEEAQKMKLSEPVAINGDGDSDMHLVGTVIHNGTNGKNGHHNCYPLEGEEEEDKENVNGFAAVEEVSTNGKHHQQQIVRDGNYFIQVLKNEQNRLLTMAADIEREMEQLETDGVELSEEVAGYVLVAAGKARLLCSQKMKQFEGLCYSNLNQLPDEKFQTTCEDLRGFWDMVMLQVDNVDASFREIDTFRRNGWKKPVPVDPVPQIRSTARSTKLLVKRPFKSNPSSSANGISEKNGTSNTVAEAKKAAAAAAAAKRDAQRKQLMELKRKQKQASSQPTPELANVEIFVPGTVNSSTAITTCSTESDSTVDVS